MLLTGVLDEDGEVSSVPHCSLCSKPFQMGEEVCRSNNDKCPHIHHRECMTHWLHLQNTCPTCNELFILVQVDTV
jgi:Ring finger domain